MRFFKFEGKWKNFLFVFRKKTDTFFKIPRNHETKRFPDTFRKEAQCTRPYSILLHLGTGADVFFRPCRFPESTEQYFDPAGKFQSRSIDLDHSDAGRDPDPESRLPVRSASVRNDRNTPHFRKSEKKPGRSQSHFLSEPLAGA